MDFPTQSSLMILIVDIHPTSHFMWFPVELKLLNLSNSNRILCSDLQTGTKKADGPSPS